MPTPRRPAPATARERARAELTREVTAAGRRQLAEVGAAQLSVRAVARELGMASSAVYRYVASRDDLLTALVVEAYDELGSAVERAEARVPRDDLRGRFSAVLNGVRDWARAHPHEYALVYGSPVPGYVAPQGTLEPARRVARVLIGVLKDAPEHPARLAPVLPQLLSTQLDTVRAQFDVEAPPAQVARLLLAWTQLFGAVSMELFGHLVGTVDPSDEYFAYVVAELADLLGLP